MMKLSKRLESIVYDGYIENILKKLSYAKHVAIFGAGCRAQFLAKFLLNRGINFEMFLVGEKYFENEETIKICDQKKRVKCFEEEIEKNCELTIVLGVSQSVIDMEIFNNSNIFEVIPISVGVCDGYLLSKKFYTAHLEEFDGIYEQLADEYSRECLFVHMAGRLTGKDISFKSNLSSDPQYIFDEFMNWERKECFVDCGAYVGDSIEEFIKKMPIDIVEEFTAYAWEPDEKNFMQLNENYKNDQRIKRFCLGAYSQKTQLYFSNGDGELSAVSNSGNITIDVDSIDNILGNEKATFIKMDIEGSEIEALIGARKQIVNNTPRLAICVYHKKEDLYAIPQLIMEYNSNYKLYLRPHSMMPTELVLFAIPKI